MKSVGRNVEDKGGVYMEESKKLPKSFFEKSRPNAPKKSLKKIIPFKWSNENEILKGINKNKKIINLIKK